MTRPYISCLLAAGRGAREIEAFARHAAISEFHVHRLCVARGLVADAGRRRHSSHFALRRLRGHLGSREAVRHHGGRASRAVRRTCRVRDRGHDPRGGLRGDRRSRPTVVRRTRRGRDSRMARDPGAARAAGARGSAAYSREYQRGPNCAAFAEVLPSVAGHCARRHGTVITRRQIATLRMRLSDLPIRDRAGVPVSREDPARCRCTAELPEARAGLSCGKSGGAGPDRHAHRASTTMTRCPTRSSATWASGRLMSTSASGRGRTRQQTARIMERIEPELVEHRAGLGGRLRRRQFHGGRGTGGGQDRPAGGTRRGGRAEPRPVDAGGGQPDRRRPSRRAAADAVAHGGRDPACRGRAGGRDRVRGQRHGRCAVVRGGAGAGDRCSQARGREDGGGRGDAAPAGERGRSPPRRRFMARCGRWRDDRPVAVPGAPAHAGRGSTRPGSTPGQSK